MKKLLLVVLFFSGLLASEKLSAQWKSTPMIMGLDWNVIENDGKNTQFFLPEQTWNYKYYPTRLTVEKMFNLGINIQLSMTYNQYVNGKTVNNEINSSLRNYFATDLLLKYDLNYLIGETAWFDPFVHVGYGYHNTTKISDLFKDRLTGSSHNLGLGFHLWITREFAMTTETTGKWAFYRVGGNHFQHSVGFVYKFGGMPGRMWSSDTFIKWSQRVIAKIKG